MRHNSPPIPQKLCHKHTQHEEYKYLVNPEHLIAMDVIAAQDTASETTQRTE